jgi:cytochrome c peroxidase
MRGIHSGLVSILLRLLPAALLLAAGPAQPPAPDMQAPRPMSRSDVAHRAASMTDLGRKLFREPALSASGQMSCASCHDPVRAFGPPNALPVQMGGAGLDQPGRRAVPSLMYLQKTPAFTEHFFESDDEGDESIDNGPTGGLGWDGRFDRGRDQARLPLLAPFEMAGGSPDSVAGRALKAGYGPALAAIYGEDVLADPGRVFDGIAHALEVYQQDPAEFYPYNSKYDRFLAGKATLTPQEAHGLELFDDKDNANCAHCHPSRRAPDGSMPQFTDFGMNALGVPRNNAIPANADPDHYDLGLCGPDRTDLADRAEYCGFFKAPSLRNTALRQTYFHNGVFHTLRQVLEFYVERDTKPEKWFPRHADGSVRKYDDLPAAYHSTVNVESPFDRQPGDPPILSDADITDIIAFLQTLTDYPPER